MSKEHQGATLEIVSVKDNYINNSGSNNTYGSYNYSSVEGSRNAHTGNTDSYNTFNNISNTHNYTLVKIDDEGHQILQWLSPLEPCQRHQGVRTDRLDSVGNWVLETSQFSEWRDAEDGSVDPVLFCYGNPGVGKTYVM